MSTVDHLSRLSPRLIVPALVAAAALLGLAVTHDARLGLAAAGALVFGAFLVVDLPVAVGIWIVALYLAGAPGTHGAVTGTSVLLLAGWAGTLADRAPHARRAVARTRWSLALVALMMLWSACSLVWAQDAGVARLGVQHWAIAVAALPVLVVACERPRDALVVAGAFVAGATIAVVVGVLTGTNAAPVDQRASFEAAAGRLQVGITDPNYLAADIVAALAITAGLLGVPAVRRLRPLLVLAIPVLLYGLVATQSRGGMIAAAVAAVAAFVLLREYRGRILGALAIVVVLLGLFLAAQPRAVDRLTQDDTSGTGRTDIWNVAVRVAGDHALLGVGTGNFVVVQPGYAQRVGFLERPGMIVDTPLVTHDVWLQALTENGVVGLALLIGAFGACILASLAAAGRFARAGRPDLAHLARAVAAGQIGSLAASTFIANGNDRVFWVLLSLGPVLLAVELATGSAARPGPPAPPAASPAAPAPSLPDPSR
jgi:O-antigen ligase